MYSVHIDEIVTTFCSAWWLHIGRRAGGAERFATLRRLDHTRSRRAHLKTTADVDVCAAARYTFFTVDPGEYVDDAANTASMSVLQEKSAALPWTILRSSPADLQRQLVDLRLDLGDFAVTLSAEEVLGKIFAVCTFHHLSL